MSRVKVLVSYCLVFHNILHTQRFDMGILNSINLLVHNLLHGCFDDILLRILHHWIDVTVSYSHWRSRLAITQLAALFAIRERQPIHIVFV